jgi:hypothetical protein
MCLVVRRNDDGKDVHLAAHLREHRACALNDRQVPLPLGRPSPAGPVPPQAGELPGRLVRFPVARLQRDPCRFEFAGREAYWLIRGKLSESPLFGRDRTKVTGGTPMTMRDMSTVYGLVAKHPSAD